MLRAHLLAAVVTAAAPQSGYITASRINLRVSPRADAPMVDKVTIGTPVRATKTKDATWCAIEVVGSALRGFTHCRFVGSERPTLEKLQAAVAKIQPSDPAFEDIVARLFFLSPAAETLLEAQRRIFASKLESPPNLRELVFALAGVRRGSDLRPVKSTWNRKALGTYAFGANDELVEELPSKRSLFTSPDDVYVLPGDTLLERRVSREGPARSPAGLTEVRYRTRLYAPWGLIEYSKLLAQGNAVLDLGPPIENGYDGPGDLRDFFGVGTVRARFPERPAVYGVTKRGRLVTGALVEVQERLANSCSNYNHVEIALYKPKDLRLVLVARHEPTKVNPKIRELGRGATGFDIDGDGILDVATLLGSWYLDNTKAYHGGPDESPGIVVININGTWQVAQSLQGLHICT